MRILVTGHRGYIGNHLYEKLKMGRDEVVGMDLYGGGGIEENAPYLFSCSPFDVIFHLAASTRVNLSFQDPIKFTYNNVLVTNYVLEIAKKHSSKIIYTSTCCSDGDIYANPYALTKYQGEQLCQMYSKLYNVSTVIPRFYNVFGGEQPNGDDGLVLGIFEKVYKEGGTLKVFGGDQRRDFIHVDDIVDGLIRLAKKEYRAEVFNFGSGKNLSIREIAQMYTCPVEFLPQREGEAQETLADISKTKEELGWSPTIDVKDYIYEFVQNNPYRPHFLSCL